MISDVFFEAVEAIEQYQKLENYAEWYSPELQAEIEAVKAAMTNLQIKLDRYGCGTSPSGAYH